MILLQHNAHVFLTFEKKQEYVSDIIADKQIDSRG